MFFEETTYIYESESHLGTSYQADLIKKANKTKQSLNDRIHISNNQTGLDDETLLQSSQEQ